MKIENINVDLLFEEKEFEEFMEVDIEIVSIDTRDRFIIEEYFNISTFEQDQEIIEESSTINLQESINTED
ncbi:12544_t:CDS:1, partial [Dentiscutata erythropus]